jgi:hypothetical protein
VERDIGAGRAGDLVKALVARPRDDGVVARAEQDVGQAEDALLRPGEHQDVVGLEVVVHRRDLAT